MNKLFFFDLEKCVTKRTLSGNSCMEKGNIRKVFFLYKKKEKLLFKEN